MILGVSLYSILMEFYIFSFAGWIYECCFVFLRDRKPINRGFLVGPVLPLYGFGGMLVYLLLRPFSGIPSLLYVMGMIVATLVEYITSWLLEVLFHTKWWDYSGQQYNFQGKIALIPSLFWGLLSLLMFDLFHPVAAKLIGSISEESGRILLAVFIVITVMDVTYTLITMINFRKQLENLYEFRKELEYLLENRKHAAIEERIRAYWEKCSRFLKKTPLIGNQRLLDAFPSMKIITKNHSAVEVRELLANLKQKAEQHRKGFGKKEEKKSER